MQCSVLLGLWGLSLWGCPAPRSEDTRSLVPPAEARDVIGHRQAFPLGPRFLTCANWQAWCGRP